MNKLMQDEKMRFGFVILSFLNFYLVKQMFLVGKNFLKGNIFYPGSIAVLISIIALCLFGIYFLAKVIWREKFLTFDKTPGYKLFATIIMLLTAYSGLYILEYIIETQEVHARNIYGSVAIYMFVITIITACFIAEINLPDDEGKKEKKDKTEVK